MSAKSKTELYVHLVWATFRREPRITPRIEQCATRAIAEKCLELRGPALAIGGMPDHLHLLSRIHPSVSVARLAAEVKGFSSYLVTEKLGMELEWQRGYAAFSISAEDVEAVAGYVADQRRHHAAQALQPFFELADD